ncbi:hypothetical protein SPBR_06731 [Sporothrix brasiliensis 5110]|uniref:Zn(2)-C6 fungal-type domain-containing protein n=1 Tax=Sporothrix brasiliensis 5110 TaxID=1398154 RepID=A0A0C2IS84_9PEZI|nr:uncharacterized protein SPBR_06731 [Sporothrix brasiliensis 5110]KIH89710.1 hypothetical protein SPBR_06731 [Sporothrix brasiliensis 5110]
MAGSRSVEAASRGPSHSAPYGQACLHCFKAKCRCVSRPDGDGCERCHRLQKTCHSSEAIRKRSRPKSSAAGATAGELRSADTADERVASIEEKLDGIMTMLQAVTQAPAKAAAAALRDVFGGRMDEHLRGVLHDGDSDGTQMEQQPLPLPPPIGQRPQTQSPRHPDTPTSLSTRPDTAEGAPGAGAAASARIPSPVLYESLSQEARDHAWSVFRSTYLPYCPFLWFPPETTSAQLQRHRPFLLRCVVASTTTLVRDKAAQGRAIKEQLAREMLVDNRSNIDLLLGLLVFIAWGSDPMVSRSGTLSRLVMLALSLVCDMRLHKPLPADQHMVTTYTGDNPKSDEKGYERVPAAAGDAAGVADDADAEGGAGKGGTDDIYLSDSEETLAKQRAVLGCFLIASSTSIYFAHIDGMNWTPQMDDCLRAVEAHTACPGDVVLAYQVRLQQVVQQAVHAREHEAALPLYITDAFRTQLHELTAARPQFPPAMAMTSGQQHQDAPSPIQLWTAVAVAHEQYVELSLSEMTFSAADTPSAADAPTEEGSTTSTETDVDRVRCYWRSVHAIRALCAALLDGVPPTAFAGVSFMVWAQLCRAVVTLVRLSTLPPLTPRVDVSIDARAVRASVDLLDVLDRFADRLKSAAAGLGRGLWRGPQRQIDDVFGRMAHLVRVLRAAVATRLETTAADADADANGHSRLAANSGPGRGDTAEPPPWHLVETVMGQTAVGWGDIWLEGMFPRF